MPKRLILMAMIVSATIHLGSFFVYGGGDKARAAYEKVDYRTVFKNIKILANQGDAPAQFNLGLKYANGKDVPQNFAEAVKWYRKAAEQGHAQAQYALGHKYYDGDGVTQDYVVAHMWTNFI